MNTGGVPPVAPGAGRQEPPGSAFPGWSLGTREPARRTGQRPILRAAGFGVGDGVPEGGVGAVGPVAERVEAGGEGLVVVLAEGEDGFADAFEDAGGVVD